MPKIIFRNETIGSALFSQEDLDPEVREELAPYWHQLQNSGDVLNSKVEYLPEVGVVKTLVARTFILQYHTCPDTKSLSIDVFQLRPNPDAEALRAMLSESWRTDEDDMRRPEVVPQADNPIDLVRTIEFIAEGIVNKQELADRLGHTGDHRHRHGYYKLSALEALGLSIKQKNTAGRGTKPVLTESGKRIADAVGNRDLQCRLLAEVMLRYEPVYIVIEEITGGEQPLGEQVLRETIDLFSPDRRKSTIERRAKCLEAWVTWLVREMDLDVSTESGRQLNLFTVQHRAGKIRRLT
jgi:hypothetical protein